ncbi:hypothetical protein HPB50_024886 [Hyalomma asiaticum]|uniref:Uncharacterized protein n=1 Tax=Hyalomma asiaticum TaxID=266040 RepID=A0ACB7SC61_HYAAI|nr:hypothetical protein HPB50_024886 [Hyalomma asiaticum]
MWIFEEIGLAPTDNMGWTIQLPREIREELVVAPLPRNVHPVHNADRRKARASAILKQIHNDKVEANFVDAAAYRDGKACKGFRRRQLGKVINCALVRTTAIALAMQDARTLIW